MGEREGWDGLLVPSGLRDGPAGWAPDPGPPALEGGWPTRARVGIAGTEGREGMMSDSAGVGEGWGSLRRLEDGAGEKVGGGC